MPRYSKPRCPICTMPINEAEIICSVCWWERKRDAVQRAKDIEEGAAPLSAEIGKPVKKKVKSIYKD